MIRTLLTPRPTFLNNLLIPCIIADLTDDDLIALRIMRFYGRTPLH